MKFEAERKASYGTIIFNRAHTTAATLFGSNIKHNEMITLEINHASVKRDLHSDWVHDENTIVSVEMSYSQFAEAISSFGMHPGVPVTIRYTEKDGYIDDRPEFANKRVQLNKELKEQMDNVSSITRNAYKSVADILNKKGSVTKDDKQQILHIMNELANAMPNTEYMYDQMIEEMDKVVLEAKNEIEAFTKRRIETIANNAIAQSGDAAKEICEGNTPIQIE